jgi:hypothetical protein
MNIVLQASVADQGRDGWPAPDGAPAEIVTLAISDDAA